MWVGISLEVTRRKPRALEIVARRVGLCPPCAFALNRGQVSQLVPIGLETFIRHGNKWLGLARRMFRTVAEREARAVH